MIFRLAARNLTRNRWRTVLTAGGIAVGVGFLIWTLAFMEGFTATMIRGATAVDLGQVQIHDDDYVESPTLRNNFELSAEKLEELRSIQHVEAVSPRVATYGLVGTEKKSTVSRLVGVEPEAEKAATVVDEGIIEGRWLTSKPPDYPAPREVVIGKGMREQLGVELGAELVLFFEAADGSLGNDLLKVVGILETGNSAVDRRYAYMHIEDLQYAAALEGRIHEATIRVDDVYAAGSVASTVRESLDRDELTVREWKELAPQIAQMLEVYDRSTWIMYVIVYFIVALGLLNAQRMSALERRREFGVSQAIGVSPLRIFGVVVLETVLLTILGAAVGGLLGWGVSAYHAAEGLSMSAFGSEQGFSYMGISFSDRLYFGVTPMVVLEPILYLVPVSLLCGLWPAWQSATIHITTAISGRN